MILTSLSFFGTALVVATAGGSVASSKTTKNPDMGHYQKLGRRIADEMVSGYGKISAVNDENHRHLVTSAQFQDVCDQVIPGFEAELDDLACDCVASTLSLSCTMPEMCIAATEVPDCNEEVCATGKIFVDFESLNSNEVYLTYIDASFEYTGASTYDAQRAVVTSNNKCAQYLSFNGTEYRCNVCEICDAEESTITIDCSNIAPDAASGSCVDSLTVGTTEEAFSLCPARETLNPQPGTDTRDILLNIEYSAGIVSRMSLGAATAGVLLLFVWM